MRRILDREWRFRRDRRRSERQAVKEPAAVPPAVAAPGRPKRRLWPFLLICLLASSAASFVAFKYIAPSIVAPSLPPELIGTWQATEGDLKGATLEFRWHGTALATSYNKQGIKEIVQSSVGVEGRKISLTTRDAAKGTDETLTQTILKLTDDELVLRDEDQKTYRLVRVRN